ncbi:prepilin-type N-terminal cleavage/methylation domain-containing protein [Pelagicoccus sp. SDUM812003]|uniref:type IV pilin protein n=1 Tax=Pelagicoccus sp. SDUM812003 TaxID=3041267 RepID=UPI0028103256|nr:prepilin-type N-terminal cleavage/methylation domain-containing protein [Pelagicoccus sp. SDUM812003]MDQ8201603.1 prepilin-type N-terminal cleavage/methylation domain-containing protein [Pelagicoccus sp. SDUM812003]
MNVKRSSAKGFTLIEIMIVVAIIGVLAFIAIPAFQKYLRNARAATFSSDVRTLAHAGAQYLLESGWYVNNTDSGTFPPELEGYFSERKFNLGTSLGGVWDFEQFGLGDFSSAVGVHGPSHGDDVFVLVDQAIDDGNLSTGLFQKLAADRYYYVIED